MYKYSNIDLKHKQNTTKQVNPNPNQVQECYHLSAGPVQGVSSSHTPHTVCLSLEYFSAVSILLHSR